MNKMLAVLLAALLTASANVPAELPAEETAPQTQLSDVSDAAVADFAVRLFRQSAVEGENTLISPLSVLAALSMTANGACENTLAQMESVLGMPSDQLNGWMRDYTAGLAEDNRGKLSLANSIWFKDAEDFTVKEDFLTVNREYYGADIIRTAFGPQTAGEINSWVEDHTDGMIREIVDEVPENAVMYLVNALAFDARWQNVYMDYQVQDGTFTTEDGEIREAEMMYAEENMYLEDDLAVGFLKYYEGRKYAFAALLPKEGVSVAEYVDSLTGEGLHTMLTGAQRATVKTAIPKFSTEYDVEMSEILKEMGMPDAFDWQKADFSRLGESEDGNIVINRVIHKTFINVDEAGTEAGAATVVEMLSKTAFLPPEQRKEVYLDRPFVYMLIDCDTGLPFFIGTMMDIDG